MNCIVKFAASSLIALPASTLAETLSAPTRPKNAIWGGPWEYLRKNGFHIKIEAEGPCRYEPQSRSACCFRAVTDQADGYVFEGHITSDLFKRVVSEKPENIFGLSIPGMPSGVPGMEGPKDGPIKVYAITKDGTTTTYATQ
jgi:hypothetical protein